MFYILISICASVTVSLLLKLSKRFDLNLGQIIALNYVSAIALCWVFILPKNTQLNTLLSSDLPWMVLILLGILLPSIFIIMGKAIQAVGIVRADAIQRLSLFLPLIAAFLIFGEQASNIRIFSIIIGLGALFCLIYKKQDPSLKTTVNSSKKQALLMLGVWLGYGVIDILFKELSKAGTAFHTGLILSFSLALFVLVIYLLMIKTKWHLHSALAGLILGIFNFTNIYFYIKAHQSFHEAPTIVFTSMNIGVISLSTVLGAWWFKEYINKANKIGIILAIISIISLYSF